MSDNRRVVVISTHISLIEKLVTDAGFEVLGAAENAFNGERLVSHFAPDVVILENDLPGEQDLSVVGRIRAAAPQARILLIVSQHWSTSDTSSLGIAGVIGRDDLLQLGDRLHDLEHTIDLTSVTGQIERRSGRDRRVHQDWTKVGWERRRSMRRASDRATQPV